MEKIAAVILAAGKGTRMGDTEGSLIPKVMFPLAGKPIIYHSVKLIKDAGINRVVLVVGYKRELIREYFGDQVEYVVQEDQLGTGHAVLMAKELLEGKTDAVIVFYGDNPLYKPETVKKLINIFETEKPTIAMLSAVSENPFGYGRIIRDENGEVLGIKEHKDCNEEELKIKEWNPGFYIFDSEWLWSNIDKLDSDNAQKEYLLTDLIKIAKEQDKKIIAILVSEESEAFGINTGEQLKEAEKVLGSRNY
ncbi:MAG: NTP transferase domain-containing protein [Patescibacteria group bacterium]|nr:NTP transferase domain-containing protein [Patescibacteria group bacterium]